MISRHSETAEEADLSPAVLGKHTHLDNQLQGGKGQLLPVCMVSRRFGLLVGSLACWGGLAPAVDVQASSPHTLRCPSNPKKLAHASGSGTIDR